jgi:hypothetical protein
MYASVFYIWMLRGGGVANKGNPGEEKVPAGERRPAGTDSQELANRHN